jgi:hypothetical protein
MSDWTAVFGTESIMPPHFRSDMIAVRSGLARQTRIELVGEKR